MSKLNNKGQSLILFVLLLPMMLLIMVLVIDIGNLLCDKEELDNISMIAISYGIKNIESDDIENKIISVINLNSDNLSDIYVLVDDDQIEVNLSKKSKTIFSNILNIESYELSSKYIGDIKNNKIKRIK